MTQGSERGVTIMVGELYGGDLTSDSNIRSVWWINKRMVGVSTEPQPNNVKPSD